MPWEGIMINRFRLLRNIGQFDSVTATAHAFQRLTLVCGERTGQDHSIRTLPLPCTESSGFHSRATPPGRSASAGSDHRLCRRAATGDASEWRAPLALRSDGLCIGIEGEARRRVPQEILLHFDICSKMSEPSGIGMPKRVPSDFLIDS